MEKLGNYEDGFVKSVRRAGEFSTREARRLSRDNAETLVYRNYLHRLFGKRYTRQHKDKRNRAEVRERRERDAEVRATIDASNICIIKL